AYLNAGDRLAVYTALGWLRSADAVGIAPDGMLTTTGPMPTGSTPLDQAVYNAAGKRIRARDLTGDQWVRTALDELRQDLVRRGLAVDPARRGLALIFQLLTWTLLGLGAFRLVNGLSNGKPIGYLLITVVGLAICFALTGRTPRRTRAGSAAVASLRDRNRHLAPNKSPAYTTYGSAGAAMGIALFGTASLWAMDP
ncbi:TIGR04222 domain-containing membrane protein, partial [Micromonospora zhanjiangensis]